MSRPLKALLCLVSLGFAASSQAQENKSVKIIEPNTSTQTVQAAAIDTEHFELGAYTGLLSVEDFNTNPVVGLSLTYHINSAFIAQVNYGQSTVSRAAFEELEGGNFLTDYDFTYTNLLGGYNLLSGRSFLGKRYKYNSAIYLLAGAANVSFDTSDNVGLVLGFSYRTVITDWLTLNLDFRNTVVERDLIALTDDKKQTQNTELLIGFNALF